MLLKTVNIEHVEERERAKKKLCDEAFSQESIYGGLKMYKKNDSTTSY